MPGKIPLHTFLSQRAVIDAWRNRCPMLGVPLNLLATSLLQPLSPVGGVKAGLPGEIGGPRE